MYQNGAITHNVRLSLIIQAVKKHTILTSNGLAQALQSDVYI